MQSQTILIAEDSLGHRKVLELILSAHNYTVISTENGHEALNYLQDNTPDLMILDINMPFATGIEVCQHAKHDQRLQNIPIIIMTSLTDTGTKNAVEEARADLLVHKPLTGQNIQQMISTLLAKNTHKA